MTAEKIIARKELHEKLATIEVSRCSCGGNARWRAFLENFWLECEDCHKSSVSKLKPEMTAKSWQNQANN